MSNLGQLHPLCVENTTLREERDALKKQLADLRLRFEIQDDVKRASFLVMEAQGERIEELEAEIASKEYDLTSTYLFGIEVQKKAMKAELAQARAEVKRLKSMEYAWKQRAKRSEAELAQTRSDVERLSKQAERLSHFLGSMACPECGAKGKIRWCYDVPTCMDCSWYGGMSDAE